MTAQQFRQMQHYPDPLKQYRGKRNRELGHQFEDAIEEACDWYRSVKEADIEKTPEPMKILKRLDNGRFIACFQKKAQPDYNGLLKGGQAVSFEAKHTETEQMEQSRVSDEQSDALDRKLQLGAKCFVVIGFSMSQYYRIPWDVWRNMKKHFRRKYVRPEDLAAYQITIGRSGKLLFLD